MNRYIAFLRGVNISGKNKVPMAQLKTGLEELGLVEVKTYLNSGNVLFSSSRDDTGALAGQIERMITAKFGWDIPVFLILKRELEDILQNAPAWWGTGGKEQYDNLIFIMPPAVFAQVLNEIGAPRGAWNRSRTIKMRSSGPSAGRTIKRPSGGPRRPVRPLAEN